MKEDREFLEKVLELATGNWDVKAFPVPESAIVSDVFYSGGPCDLAYERMHSAYQRLCQRIDPKKQEDPDAEIMIDRLIWIGKELSCWMFRYGVFFGANPGFVPAVAGYIDSGWPFVPLVTEQIQ